MRRKLSGIASPHLTLVAGHHPHFSFPARTLTARRTPCASELGGCLLSYAVWRIVRGKNGLQRSSIVRRGESILLASLVPGLSVSPHACGAIGTDPSYGSEAPPRGVTYPLSRLNPVRGPGGACAH